MLWQCFSWIVSLKKKIKKILSWQILINECLLSHKTVIDRVAKAISPNIHSMEIMWVKCDREFTVSVPMQAPSKTIQQQCKCITICQISQSKWYVVRIKKKALYAAGRRRTGLNCFSFSLFFSQIKRDRGLINWIEPSKYSDYVDAFCE